MKISNSKKQLAKIIHENGGWRDGAKFASQGRKTGAIGFVRTRPRRCRDVWQTVESALVEVIHPDVLIPNWHQTILSRDEYFYLYPAPVEVVIENKTSCHLTVTDKPTIEQLAADYRNLKDYADRKQQEADAAKADAEAKLAELVAAGEVLGLVLSVTGSEPGLVITDWRDLLPGDEIECVGGSWASWATGRIAVVREVESADYAGCIPVRVELDGESDWGNNFKFIRRPTKGEANA